MIPSKIKNLTIHGISDDELIDDLRSLRYRGSAQLVVLPPPEPDANGHMFVPNDSRPGFVCMKCNRFGTLAELTPVEKLGPCRPTWLEYKIATSTTTVKADQVPEGEIWVGIDAAVHPDRAVFFSQEAGHPIKWRWM
ncbi:hypothetical protein PQU92_08090 [Asticcacaulis sp. BYS171W]|uniref:Zinc finger CHC2-type domain-containing protein n=1 Tax=Asticcacaulis aquaticus TaxID=2984212 RepID=A0ABT5HT74_9CAUL|nr:hypothetical protein [Asticcacaulis aquaticus]MDC7683234.1 hypothetical protein [Asticcacaulis aquaticus]